MDRCVLEQINKVNKQRDGQRMKDSQSYQSSVTGKALHTLKKTRLSIDHYGQLGL